MYTYNAIQETEIRKKIPFDRATRKIKYLGRNLTKEVNDLSVLRKLHNTEERNQRHKEMEIYTVFMDWKN